MIDPLDFREWRLFLAGDDAVQRLAGRDVLQNVPHLPNICKKHQNKNLSLQRTIEVTQLWCTIIFRVGPFCFIINLKFWHGAVLPNAHLQVEFAPGKFYAEYNWRVSAKLKGDNGLIVKNTSNAICILREVVINNSAWLL